MNKPVFFDRGIPDNLGYACLFGLELAHFKRSSLTFKYNTFVFITKNCRDIYKTDDERTMSFDQSCAFGQIIRNVYKDYGYSIIDIPIDTPENRANFITDTIT